MLCDSIIAAQHFFRVAYFHADTYHVEEYNYDNKRVYRDTLRSRFANENRLQKEQ